MWANDFGQLCLGNQKNQSTFQQTTFSNISKVSLGNSCTLFQNDRDEIYSCGSNRFGELGLGHCKIPQLTPTLIPNLPPNIVQFICGSYHSLFLDAEGNVFSVGYNQFGQLGLGHIAYQNVLNQIANIPPIRTISCLRSSSYLVDFEGNLWTFGKNSDGQLGLGDTKDKYLPTKIECLKNIQQISYGSQAGHFLAKDSQNSIFVAGYNVFGQLGTGYEESYLIPKEIDSKYFTIWGDMHRSKCKSARK